MKGIKVGITGISPLLLHRITMEEMERSNNPVSVRANGKDSPREAAAVRLYLGQDGKTPVIPQPNLFRCIVDAGIYFKNGKSKITTAKSSLVPACVGIEELEFPIKSKHDWQTDSRPVCNPSTGGRMLCHRPRFDDWTISFTLTLDESMLPEKVLREMLDAAGLRVGIGAWRPARKGPFGKFRVDSWKASN